MKKSIKVLLIEDEPGDAFLIEEMLSESAEPSFDLELAVNLKQAVTKLSVWDGDIILLDLGLPDSKGLESLEILLKLNLEKPILVITGLADDQVGRKSITLGAQNYLVKGQFDDFSLIRAIWYSIERHIHNMKIRESEKKLEENNQLLEEANAQKNRLFSIISHDLRSPFNTIIGLLDILYSDFDETTNDKKKQIIKTCIESAHNTFDLIENLLEWALVQSNKIKIEPQQLNLNLLVNKSLEAYMQGAMEKKILVSVKISNDLEVFADLEMITTVMRNLFSNAVKFTPRGGKISIESNGSQKDKTTVCINDSGLGIEKENLNKIFNVGEGFTTPGTENEKGTGLGLILCKEFIEKNNGELWLESEVGSGTRVSFTLPVSTAANSKVQTENTLKTAPVFSDSRKILLVEDDESVAMYFITVLKTENIEILHAVNGKEAIEMVKKNSDIQLIFMDIRMPVMNGIEASKVIRKLFPLIPIVAQTAFFREDYSSDETDLTFDDFLMKPVKKQNLFSMVEKYVQVKI